MTRLPPVLLVPLCIAALVAASLAALILGARNLPPVALIEAALDPDPRRPADLILRHARLPRLAAGLTVGAALGLCGAILQVVLRNPLADPGLLGVSSGAALAVVVLTALLPAAPALSMLALAALAGGAAAGALTLLLSGGLHRAGAEPLRLLLGGAVVAMALGAATGVVMRLTPGALEATQLWLAGSLADRPAGMVAAYAPWVAAIVLPVLIAAPALAPLVLDEAQMRSLGAEPARMRGAVLLAAMGLAGVAVALAGPVGFVGLVAPHLARGLAGPLPARMFPVAAALGAALTVAADAMARRIAPPAELPVGILTAVAGVPMFLILLRRARA